jgi:hypothetical protein
MAFLLREPVTCRPLARQCLVMLLIASCALLSSGCQWMPQQWPWQAEEAVSPATAQRNAEVKSLVAQGDLAFTKDRLSVPAKDNAVLYYRKALALDSDNKSAHAGLDKVSRRYCDLAMTAHGNGRAGQADQYLKRAEDISGSNDQIATLRQTIKTTPKGSRPRELQVPASTQQELQARIRADYRLPQRALDARGPEIHQLLDAIARRAKASQSAVRITARNTDEGEWIQQTLRAAPDGSALKTLLEIGEQPAILLTSDTD